MSRTLVVARHIRTLAIAAVVAAAPLTLSAQAAVDSSGPARGVATSIDTAAAPTAATSVMYREAAVAARIAPRPDAAASQESARAALAQERHVGAGQNVALMVVGAAGLVTGLLIGGGGGAAIAVGGAVVGLYGLYRFVQ